ncbi:MAG: poly(3-hydroxyalkanoate) depolymerase [Nocardioides sp.]|uniref:poly(3-hydroxyalkanoate) depolymerase n=1 Tax=Nocardioides sp. TaxID=35761 RepID=UPI0039E3A148
MTDAVRDLDVRGTRMRVSVRRGTGTPLLLCNGIGASLDLLQPFVDRLDPAIPVVRFDVPGVGGSPLPRRPYSFFSLARLLGRLLDELGYDEFDVLGISWGGGLAQQLALQHARRCRRLVLASTAPGWMMVPAQPGVLRHLVTVRRYRDMSHAAAIAPDIYGGALRDDPDRVREILDGHSPLTSTRGYLLQLLAAAGWTSLPLLPLLRQRTLILAGSDDPIIPLINARIMAALIPHSELVIYDDGHLGLIVAADRLAPAVTGFLRAS